MLLSDWVSCSQEYPKPFDLVLVKDDRGIIQPAWWTGAVWDYGKKRIHGKITMWTRKGVDHYEVALP